MGLIGPSFRDITMKTGYMKARIGLAIFNGRFKEAQKWLDREIVKKMTPYVPYKTGQFLGKILNENAARVGTGKIVTAVPPQGKRLYPGISSSGKPFNWTNPDTQPRWGSYTVQTYKPELLRGVRDIIIGRKK